jgi:NAD(P)-dependent dehydrogenase (short-subunit alcohol dehydrogenase family)
MFEGFNLAGLTAVVTGGANGYGTGICEVLAEAGAKVVIADIQSDAAEAMAESLHAAGAEADWVELDLADEASVVAACAQIVERHGAPWLLVNNAGVQDREMLLDMSAAEWDRNLAINARGPFLMTRELQRRMRSRSILYCPAEQRPRARSMRADRRPKDPAIAPLPSACATDATSARRCYTSPRRPPPK